MESNEVALAGELTAIEPLRYTPAGVALINFRLLHRSQQKEAGVKRQVECEINGVAMAEVAKAMSGLIDGMVRTVREVSARLRPEVLDELGLVAAIKWQARDFEVRAGIRCKVDAPVEDLAIDLACATAVFRVFQELLTNVARHASATKVDVSLHMLDSNVQLEVRDNGRGIRDAEIRNPASLGLLGMRERVVAFGGRVKLEARGSGGTRATVTIPIEACLPTGKQAVS